MREILTEEKKEEFCVKAFSNINLLNKETERLDYEYAKICEELKELCIKYDELKEDYREICLLQIGKGKYYEIKKLPIVIEQKIDKLSADAYDSYRGLINENNKRKMELLIPILKEELKKAQDDEKKLEEFIRNTEDEYYSIRSQISTLEKRQRKIISKQLKNTKIAKKLLIKVKKVENAYDKSKKIDIERSLKLVENKKM